MTEESDVPLRETDRVLVGMRETLRALEENRVEFAVLADDADEHVKLKVFEACKARGVRVNRHPCKKTLGEEMGLQVSAAVISILKEASPLS